MYKNKLIGSVAVALVIIFMIVLYQYLPRVKNGVSVMRLSGHPAVESLSIVLFGDATNIKESRFDLVVDGKRVSINTDERTSFWQSAEFWQSTDEAGGLSRPVYQIGDIKEGQTIRVTGVILSGGVWANGIIAE